MTHTPRLVAIVDDEESVRLAFARVLRTSSFAISSYASGEEFLQSLSVETPDCVLLDCHMPGLSGADVQKAMSHTGVPIIIITAFDEPSLREHYLAAGACAYFSKPVRRDALIAALNAAIGP